MNARLAIEHALQHAGVRQAIQSMRDLSGGCIHQVSEITLEDGQRFVAKVNHAEKLPLFEEEADSLRALAATNTVLVPEPLAVIAHQRAAVLLMTAIDTVGASASHDTWRRFGEELAALHRAVVGSRYGFKTNNHIGSTPQPNGWHDDWVEFNAVNRLGFQLKTAIDNDLLRQNEAASIQRVIDRLDHFIPRKPKPALLHGDLWSGNALPSVGGRIAVIDPACSIGDGWADIGMMRLFGGFSSACFESYDEQASDHENVAQRIRIYQLYHVLNHVNIFGRSYVSQAMNIAQELT